MGEEFGDNAAADATEPEIAGELSTSHVAVVWALAAVACLFLYYTQQRQASVRQGGAATTTTARPVQGQSLGGGGDDVGGDDAVRALPPPPFTAQRGPGCHIPRGLATVRWIHSHYCNTPVSHVCVAKNRFNALERRAWRVSGRKRVERQPSKKQMKRCLLG